MGDQSHGITLAKVLAALGLAIVAVFFGAVGACFLMVRGSEFSFPDPVGFIVAAGCWLWAAALLAGIVRVLR
jgi:hypothetical protein